MMVLYTRWRFEKNELYLPQKIMKTIHETVFTFELHSAEPLHFDEIFSCIKKFQNYFRRHLTVILDTIGTKVDLPL